MQNLYKELCLCFNLKKKNMLNKLLNIRVKFIGFLGKIFSRLNTIKIWVIFAVGLVSIHILFSLNILILFLYD